MIRTSTLAPARVHLHDGNFRRLGQLPTAARVGRTFKHAVPQQIDTATLEIAIDDPLLDQLPCDDPFGRTLVIESDAYPDPWVGKVVTVAASEVSGVVAIAARGWEGIFAERFLGPGDRVAGSAAACFRTIVDRLNATNPTGVGLGRVADAGQRFEAALPDCQGLRALDTLARQTGNEWWLSVGEVTAAGIGIDANFGPAKGDNLFHSHALHDGANCDVLEWTVDGEAAAFATSVTGGQESPAQMFRDRRRATAVAGGRAGLSAMSGDRVVAPDDAGLRTRHGLVFGPRAAAASPATRRQELAVVENLTGLQGVEAAAVAHLQRRPFAARRARVVCHWRGPGSWDALVPGNVLRLDAPHAFGHGFDGPVSIAGVQPDEEAGRCDVVVWFGASDC